MRSYETSKNERSKYPMSNDASTISTRERPFDSATSGNVHWTSNSSTANAR
jgi:hypothetical protein